MPASLRDWLPEDHLAWFVLDAVGELDLSAFYAPYREDGWGRKAYEPSMMVALLLYANCEGERSSRQIDRRCREDVAFRVLTANQQPDHATICRSRQHHEQALAGLFGGVLGLCAEVGLLRVGVVALDGTKLSANASRERNRTAVELEAEARRILAEAERVDAEENARFGEARGDELPAGFRNREERLQRLREARERLAVRERERQGDYEGRLRSRAAKDRRGRRPKPPEPEPDAKVNVSDPGSRDARAALLGTQDEQRARGVAPAHPGGGEGRAERSTRHRHVPGLSTRRARSASSSHSGRRRRPRSLTTSSDCGPSMTSRPSTTCTCARRTRSSPRSRRSGCASG